MTLKYIKQFHSKALKISLNWDFGYENVSSGNPARMILESGRPCLSWYDLDLHWLAPNGDLERNACRSLLVRRVWHHKQSDQMSL
jgi:hypothetical protein